jgi:nitrogen fixation NifU-like protein
VSDDLDRVAEELQETIIKDARAHYSDTVVDLWLRPRNFGVLDHPDGYARITGPCGDTMEIFLQVEEHRISRATFTTDGCGPSLASGSIATQLAVGKSPEETRAITSRVILEALGGLPKESEHCALLAVNVLSHAVSQYLTKSLPKKS